jgi:hypothetical protein
MIRCIDWSISTPQMKVKIKRTCLIANVNSFFDDRWVLAAATGGYGLMVKLQNRVEVGLVSRSSFFFFGLSKQKPY